MEYKTSCKHLVLSMSSEGGGGGATRHKNELPFAFQHLELIRPAFSHNN